MAKNDGNEDLKRLNDKSYKDLKRNETNLANANERFEKKKILSEYYNGMCVQFYDIHKRVASGEEKAILYKKCYLDVYDKAPKVYKKYKQVEKKPYKALKK